MFEQQRLIPDFADDRDAPFLLEAARMYYCVPVRRLCPCTPKWDGNNLSNSVDPNQTVQTEAL